MARKNANGRSPEARDRSIQLVGVRFSVFFVALGVMVLLTAAAFGLSAIWALLILGDRDFTLSDRTMPLWPEWLMPVDLLRQYAWVYLAGALGLLFLILPFCLSLLEQLVLAARSRRGKQIPGQESPEQ